MPDRSHSPPLDKAGIPPGPTGRALLNYLRILQRNPLEALSKSVTEYGDAVHFQIGWLHAYLLNHPDTIQHVLQLNSRNYSKDTFQYNLLSAITGRGLLTSDGDFWLRQRRLIQPAFHRTRIQSLGTMITQATEKMLDGWESHLAGGNAIDVDAEMMRLTLEIVGKALFSADLTGTADRLTGAVMTALDHIIHKARNPIRLPSWIPVPRERTFRQALKDLDEAVYALISMRRKSPTTEKLERELDLLDMLLQAKDEQTGESMTDLQLRDEVITLIIAGHETVASALTWTWYLLARNPQFFTKLSRQVSQALAGKLPTTEVLPDLPYLRMVFEEALRLYPPAWIITRKALESDRVEGFEIAPGSLVVISPYTIHRHPDYWSEPGRFNPDRFDSLQSQARPRFTFIPFGAGPRLCIGESFAYFEAQLIIACIVQRFHLELENSTAVFPEPLVTLRPSSKLLMRALKE